MALSQRLDIRQGQTLVMTPQLQQAIKLLQMSNMELQGFVETELERNPLLERQERGEVLKTDPAAKQATITDTVTALDGPESQIERLRTLDTDLENVYTHEARADASNRQAGSPSESGWASLRPSTSNNVSFDNDDFVATLARAETLSEHLTDQLNLYISDPADRLIGQHLIGTVNDAGYLTASLEDISAHLGTSPEHVDKVLSILKTFDPVGVFARDLKECLMLQLQEQDRLDPAMATLVSHLELVARHDLNTLKSLCKLDLDDIKDMISELKNLNPKPGNAFGDTPVQPVMPDVFVRLAQDGSWLVELNNETLPKVLLNNQYLSKVSQKTSRQEDKNYLSECHASANWLIKSLDQRAKTILKVAREIVRQQDAFLVMGVQYLRPINLKVVADAIEMHESTVSRVTSNKYIATPRGTYEMKYFFTQGIASTDAAAEMHSAESVRQRIKAMIAEEQPDAILSDDTLVEQLKTDGIEIARRTVAKYRESLNIPSSIQRRRQARS